METQSQDTARLTRLESARQAALGTLARARETLQAAATTVPGWAREVESRAGVQVDALLERVGLVRIAKVDSQRPAAAVEGVPAEVPVEAPAAAVAAPVEAVAPVTEEVVADSLEAAPAEPAASAAPAAASAPKAEHASDRPGRRRRH